MLRLVSSNKPKPKVASQPQERNKSYNRAPFAVDVRLQGSHLYVMTAQDPSHSLGCELVLETEPEDGGTVICHFPKIDDDMLLDFVLEDETLFGIIMIQFQMKLLEQLLKFCLSHQASMLVIYTDDEQAEDLGIYKEFLVHKGQTVTQKGEQTKLMVPANQKSYEDWVDFMRHVKLKFQQTLWQYQRSNVAIQQYVKLNPFG